MITLINKLYWMYYRLVNDRVPHPEEVWYYIVKYYYTSDLNEHRLMYRKIGKLYADEYPINYIAAEFQTSRERIRKILCKIVNDKPDVLWYNNGTIWRSY